MPAKDKNYFVLNYFVLRQASMLGCDAKTRQAIEKNIHSVLSVINLVLRVNSDTSQVRAMMDELLKGLESRYYLAD